MKELIGKKINRILVSGDQERIVFDTDGGLFAYEGYGECCSETWFADISGVDALLGATITDACAVEMDAVEDGRTRQDSDEFYGIKFVTSKGYADLVYRNSSNGYYGGSAERLLEVPDTTGWEDIKADWQASNPTI